MDITISDIMHSVEEMQRLGPLCPYEKGVQVSPSTFAAMMTYWGEGRDVVQPVIFAGLPIYVKDGVPDGKFYPR